MPRILPAVEPTFVNCHRSPRGRARAARSSGSFRASRWPASRVRLTLACEVALGLEATSSTRWACGVIGPRRRRSTPGNGSDNRDRPGCARSHRGTKGRRAVTTAPPAALIAGSHWRPSRARAAGLSVHVLPEGRNQNDCVACSIARGVQYWRPEHDKRSEVATCTVRCSATRRSGADAGRPTSIAHEGGWRSRCCRVVWRRGRR
jgi:hypothetical protein